MPETLSPDIRTGYDTQTAFDIKLDTFNRMNEVFNRPSQGTGIDYFDPIQARVGQSSTTDTTTIAPMSFDDALMSRDPKVRDMALSTLEKDAYSNPYARLNIGKEFRTPVTRQVNKFIDDKYGFDMFSDNEDFYYRNSYLDDGWFVRAMKNVLWRFPSRVVVGAATKFVEGVGYLGSMVTNGVIDGAKALAGKETNYWEDVADNALSKVMKNMDNDFRDYVVPVYKQAGFDEKGFFSQLGNYNFWNDSFADGVAFMASMFIPAGVASKTGLLAKGVSLGAEIGTEASAAARIGSAIRTGVRVATGAETYGEAGLSIFNTANEAAFQATQQYSDTKQALLDARARGENEYTDREIQERSGKAASSSFGWNFPALMISNAWEMKNIIKPLAGRTKNAGINTTRTIIEDTGHVGFKPYKSAAIGKLANSYVGKVAAKYIPIAAKGTLVEGFWEENIQTAIDRAARGQYTRFGDDTDSAGVLEKAHGGFFGILEQYVRQSIDALKGNDREIASSIGVGALLGGIGGITGAKFGRRIVPGEFVTTKEGNQIPRTSFVLGERKQAAKALNLAFAETNNAYNNFLSVQDVRKEDGTIDEAKLADKVASFESFAAKQEILNDLKTNKSYKPEELQMLQNNLLNDYVRGLAKVGKIEDAVKRMQDLANRNVDAKSEQFISNPLETARYLTEAAKIYAEEQAKPNHVSSEYSPAEMEQINTSIKDRSFDLRAARLAMDPVLKNYEKQASDNLTELLGFLQSGPKLQETLTRLRARDYIEAQAKKEVYQALLDKDAPEFLKDYHKSKIKEADDAIASYNKELGQDAPTIDKDGRVKFKDKDINFEDKHLIRLLDVYKNAYSDVADVEFMQQHNEHIAKSITDPVDGLANWEDYLEYVKRAIEEKNLPTQQATTTPTETTSTPTVQQIADRIAKGEKITSPEDLKFYQNNKEAIEQILKDKVKTTTTTPPVDTTEDIDETSPDVVITDEEGGGKDQADTIDPENDLSWYTPNKSGTNDTNIIGEDAEQLKDVPYDEARKEVVFAMSADPDKFNGEFKLFMVKDTFPAIYRPPANNENKETEVVPTGEVIIIEKKDGTIATLKDFVGDKYKDLGDLPVVFSAEDKIFRNYLVANRAAIWARKMKKEAKDAYAFYDEENKRNLQARELINKEPNTKIQLELIEATDGMMPTTKVAPVTERFGENFTLSVKKEDTKNFAKGSIVVTFGKVSFSVGSARLASNGSELVKLQKIIGNGTDVAPKQFDSYEQANQVRVKYLNHMFYTDKLTQKFSVKKLEDGKYIIVFKKLDKKDKDLAPEKKSKAMKESNAYGDLRFNVSATALENGMNIYNPDTGIYSNITADEYLDFIKPKVVTYFKKTTDKDGNLYMKPVNAYFSFNITDPRISKVDDKEAVQKKNFDHIVATIKQQVDNQTLTPALIDGHKKNLVGQLGKKAISQEQFNKLNQRLDEIKKELKNKPAPKPKPAPVKPAPTTEITPQAHIIGQLEEAIKDLDARKKAIKTVKKYFKENLPLVNIIARIETDFGIKLDNPEAVAVPKTETKLPEAKTEEVEDDEEKRAKEAKAKNKGKKKTDVDKVLGNTEPKVVSSKQYGINYKGEEHTLNTTNGYINKEVFFGTVAKNFTLTKADKDFAKILDEIAKAYPFQQAEDGTITGILKTQLEGTDMTIIAYGLPMLGDSDVFVDETGSAIISKDSEGVEIPATDFVRSLLTDKGKQQLDDFLKRNCK